MSHSWRRNLANRRRTNLRSEVWICSVEWILFNITHFTLWLKIHEHWGRDSNPARRTNFCRLPCVFSCSNKGSEFDWRTTKEPRRVLKRLRRGKSGRKPVWIVGDLQSTRQAQYRWANLSRYHTGPSSVRRRLAITSCSARHVQFMPTLSCSDEHTLLPFLEIRIWVSNLLQ
jgi:hypothetical protein